MTLLTVSELQGFITTSLDADRIQDLLDAAEEAIIRHAGPTVDDYPISSVTDYVTSIHGDLLMLTQRAESIVTVIEYAERSDPTTLAADDYELQARGTVLRRVRDGTNAAWHWRPDVSVEYNPFTDLASRKIAQMELVRLDLTTNPALASYTTGSDSETYRTDLDYAAARKSILESLTDNWGIW